MSEADRGEWGLENWRLPACQSSETRLRGNIKMSTCVLRLTFEKRPLPKPNLGETSFRTLHAENGKKTHERVNQTLCACAGN